MGLAPSPNVYHGKISLLILDLENVKLYFDDILILEFESFESDLLTLQEVFTQVRKANLQMAKSKSAATETEYLGFNILRLCVKPQEKNIKLFMNIATPTNVRQSFE